MTSTPSFIDRVCGPVVRHPVPERETRESNPAFLGTVFFFFFFFSFVRAKIQSPRWRWQRIAGSPGYRRACGLRECDLVRFCFWVDSRWGRIVVDVLLSDCQYRKGTALYGRCLTASTTRALLCMADVWLPVPQGHCSVWPMSDCQYRKSTALYGRCLTASTTEALLCMADVWLPVPRALLCMVHVWPSVPQGHCCVWLMSDCQYHKGTAVYGWCLTVSTTRALLCMACLTASTKGTAVYGRCGI